MAERTGFDLGAMLAELGNVSDSDTGREQIEYIDRSLLDNDPNNFYELRDLEKLADNIATCGLQQPIRVRKHPDTEGRYMIVSGHRRRAAVEILAKDDPDHWQEIPCIVDRSDASPSLRQLQLIYANAHTRALTSAEISEQAVQVEMLLYQLKEEGHEFPGRMRDHVAAAVGASTSKLARLAVIRNKLDSAWQPMFQKDQIGESVAYALAKMPETWQSLMYLSWKDKPKCLCEGHVKNSMKHFNELSKKKCKLDPYAGCWANQPRIQHIAGMGQYESCKGCCLDCYDLKRCKYSCPSANRRKKELIQADKDYNASLKAEKLKQIEPTLDFIRGVYARWSGALAIQGLSAEAYLKACGRTWSAAYDGRTFEGYANAPSKIKAENTKLPFPQNFWPHDARSLVAAADVLGCSIDWLLGRDVPGPQSPEASENESAVWRSGMPEENGEYAVFCRYPSGLPDVTSMEWRNGTWYEFNEPIYNTEVLLWTAFPEVP